MAPKSVATFHTPGSHGQVLMWPKGKTFDDAIVIGEQEGGLYKLKEKPDQAWFMTR